MNHEGVSTAAHGRERMAGCCVEAHITHSDLYHPGIRTHQATVCEMILRIHFAQLDGLTSNACAFYFVACTNDWESTAMLVPFCEAAYSLPHNQMVRFPARGCLLHVISLSLSTHPVSPLSK